MHLTDIPYIDAKVADRLFSQFAIKIKDDAIRLNSTVQILVFGGAAMALKYDYRSTVDIDADIRFKGCISEAIKEIALENNILNDWLNQDVTASMSYNRKLWEYVIPYKQYEGFMNVFVINDIAQLAMKLKSNRDKDRLDIQLLTGKCKENGIKFEQLSMLYTELYNESLKYKRNIRYVRGQLK